MACSCSATGAQTWVREKQIDASEDPEVSEDGFVFRLRLEPHSE
jgi:hypothetical protein